MLNKHYLEKILYNQIIAKDTYLLKLTCSEQMLKFFRPGQFGHIEIPQHQELFLRRPISINYVDYHKKEVHFVYQVVGKGTAILAMQKEGDTLDVVMPLGKGFALKEEQKKVWLIGGGVGVAPLKSLSAYYPNAEYTAFLGFRSKDYIYQQKDFESFAKTIITTDDGTAGREGFITEVLRQEVEKTKPDVILACGPHVFFKSLANVVGDIPTFVSLEQHMGCGTGGCTTCVCKIGEEYKKVCLQGPVFNIKEVSL